MAHFKKYLLTGLLVWVPLGITLWVLNLIIGTLDQLGTLLPQVVRPDFWLLKLIAPYAPFLGGAHHIPGFGVVLTVLVVLVTGIIATNVLGRRLLQIGELLLNRIPIVRSIYSSVKQVSDTVFSDSGQAFRKALLVQFPHQGTWTVGFMTGAPGGEIADHLGDDLVSVFVPTTPNPTSGFLFMARRGDVRELNMSVDEALKYVISMGVVQPSGRTVAAPPNATVAAPV
ncbi:DUF502 domain-containing protein [Silvimonas amylolytica]|uniref:DUF502 domain-containing protein n=1 Tax=Silvimonas amylolytica TaxID=449663 RepID=A0ABQ2PK64_9NEIS|nr:DUF502 domain-containing protein [Silvimonas amylolytica]GGP25379.1 hypothetical protein GCM10010971_11980 [Silvimonas amylolytica]